jgi:hypothetical protein
VQKRGEARGRGKGTKGERGPRKRWAARKTTSMGGMIKKKAEWLGAETSVNHLPQTSVWDY